MRPVNLLPTRYRKAEATGALSGSAYVLVGVLGALLLAVTLYAWTSRDVSSLKDKTEKLKTETAQAEASKISLASFEDFSSIKNAREQSIMELAQQRIDWERVVRELARLVPPGVWLKSVDASGSTGGGADPAAGGSASSSSGEAGSSSAGESGGSGSEDKGSKSGAPAAGPSPAAGAAGSSGSAGGTSAGALTLKLSGCARRQADVATTLVRLREMHGAKDVDLTDSSRAESGSGSGGSAQGGAPSGTPATPAGSSGAAGGATDCTRIKFEATVTLEPQPEESKPPASLGGGS